MKDISMFLTSGFKLVNSQNITNGIHWGINVRIQFYCVTLWSTHILHCWCRGLDVYRSSDLHGTSSPERMSWSSSPPASKSSLIHVYSWLASAVSRMQLKEFKDFNDKVQLLKYYNSKFLNMFFNLAYHITTRVDGNYCFWGRCCYHTTTKTVKGDASICNKQHWEKISTIN